MPISLGTFTADVVPNEAGWSRAVAGMISRTRRSTDMTHILPLGRITGAANEFQKSLAASNARVIAFGASVGVLNVLSNAFRSLVKATIEVEQQLTQIEAIFQIGGVGMKAFASRLFETANATSTSFGDAAKAAAELARQGLSVEDTLKRTAAALTLSKLGGMDVNNALSSLTSTINGFSREMLNANDILEKMTAVDAAFAVSSDDLAEALRRVGSSANDANISFSETIALVSSAQQITARGGSVIGNSFKSMFTRLQRPQVLEDLESMGVAIRKASGEMLPIMQIMKNMASAYDNMSSSQRSFVSETVGGVYQINVLKAVLSDLGSGLSIFERAMQTAENSTGAVERRMSTLNETISNQLVRTMNDLTQTFSTLGTTMVGPSIKSGLATFSATLKALRSTAEPKFFENQGGMMGGAKMTVADVAQGGLKGLSNLAQGPLVQFLTFTLMKLFGRLQKFIIDSAKDLTGVNQKEREREAVNASITSWLGEQKELLQGILNGTVSSEEAAQGYLQHVRDINNELAVTQSLIGGIAPHVYPKVSFSNKDEGAARGHIPNMYGEIEGARRGGYQAGRVFNTVVHNGSFSEPVTVNSAETKATVAIDGKKYTWVQPPQYTPAANKHRRESLKRCGIDPYSLPQTPVYASGGAVPNLAIGLKKRGVLGYRIEHDDTGSYLDFTDTPKSMYIDFRRIDSFRKGDAYSLFQQLNTRAQASRKPIRTGGLSPQLGQMANISDADDNYTNFKRIFPQLRFMDLKDLNTSGIAEVMTGRQTNKIPFKSFGELRGAINALDKKDFLANITLADFKGLLSTPAAAGSIPNLTLDRTRIYRSDFGDDPDFINRIFSTINLENTGLIQATSHGSSRALLSGRISDSELRDLAAKKADIPINAQTLQHVNLLNTKYGQLPRSLGINMPLAGSEVPLVLIPSLKNKEAHKGLGLGTREGYGVLLKTILTRNATREGISTPSIDPSTGMPRKFVHEGDSDELTEIINLITARKLMGMSHGKIPNLAWTPHQLRKLVGLGVNINEDILAPSYSKMKDFEAIPDSVVGSLMDRYGDEEGTESLIGMLKSATRAQRTGAGFAKGMENKNVYNWMRSLVVGNPSLYEDFFAEGAQMEAVKKFTSKITGKPFVDDSKLAEAQEKGWIQPRHIQSMMEAFGPTLPFLATYEYPGSKMVPKANPQYRRGLEIGGVPFEVPMPYFGHLFYGKKYEALKKQEATRLGEPGLSDVNYARKFGDEFDRYIRAIAEKHGVTSKDTARFDIPAKIADIIKETNIPPDIIMSALENKSSVTQVKTRQSALKTFHTLASWSPSSGFGGPIEDDIPVLAGTSQFAAGKKTGIIDADAFLKVNKSTKAFEALIYAATAMSRQKGLKVHYGPMTSGKTTESLRLAGGEEYVLSEEDLQKYEQFIINKTDTKNLTTGVFGLALSAASNIEGFFDPRLRGKFAERLQERNRLYEGKNAQQLGAEIEQQWKTYEANMALLSKKHGSRFSLHQYPESFFKALGHVPNLSLSPEEVRKKISSTKYPSSWTRDIMASSHAQAVLESGWDFMAAGAESMAFRKGGLVFKVPQEKEGQGRKAELIGKMERKAAVSIPAHVAFQQVRPGIRVPRVRVGRLAGGKGMFQRLSGNATLGDTVSPFGSPGGTIGTMIASSVYDAGQKIDRGHVQTSLGRLQFGIDTGSLDNFTVDRPQVLQTAIAKLLRHPELGDEFRKGTPRPKKNLIPTLIKMAGINAIDVGGYSRGRIPNLVTGWEEVGGSEPPPREMNQEYKTLLDKLYAIGVKPTGRTLKVDLLGHPHDINPAAVLRSAIETGQFSHIDAGSIIGPRIPHMVTSLARLLPRLRKENPNIPAKIGISGHFYTKELVRSGFRARGKMKQVDEVTSYDKKVLADYLAQQNMYVEQIPAGSGLKGGWLGIKTRGDDSGLRSYPKATTGEAHQSLFANYHALIKYLMPDHPIGKTAKRVRYDSARSLTTKDVQRLISSVREISERIGTGNEEGKMWLNKYNTAYLEHAWPEGMAGGMIPDLMEAVKAESRATGGHVAISRSPRLVSPLNRLGLAAIDPRSQSNADDAINQHQVFLGQSMGQIKGMRSALGKVPNLAIEGEGLFSNMSLINSIVLGLAQNAQSVEGTGKLMEKYALWATTPGKSKITSHLVSEEGKQVAQLKRLNQAYDEAIVKLRAGKDAMFAGQTFRVDTKTGAPSADTMNALLLARDKATGPTTESLMAIRKDREESRRRISSFAIRSSVATGLVGGVVTQAAEKYSPRLGAATQELTSGLTTASQVLQTFPNKWGKAGALGVSLLAVSSAVTVYGNKIANHQRALDIQKSRYQTLTSQLDSLMATIGNFDSMLGDASVSVETLSRQQRKIGEILAQLGGSPEGRKAVDKYMAAPDTKSRIAALSDIKLEEQRQMEGSEARLGILKYAAGQKSLFGLLGNPLGASNEVQDAERKMLVKTVTASTLDMADQDLKDKLMESANNAGAFSKVLEEASNTNLGEYMKSLAPLGKKGVGVIESSMREQLLAEKMDRESSMNPEVQEKRIRESQRQERINAATRKEAYTRRLFASQSQVQSGLVLDTRMREAGKEYGSAIYGTPKSVGISSKQAASEVLGQTFGTETMKRYDFAVEMERANAERVKRVREVSLTGDRQLIETITSSMGDVDIAKDLYDRFQPGGAGGVRNVSQWQMQMREKMNLGIQEVVKSSTGAGGAGSLIKQFSKPTGEMDFDALNDAIVKATNTTGADAEAIRTFLQNRDTDKALDITNTTLKEILNINTESDHNAKASADKLRASIKSLEMARSMTYMGGATNLMDRKSRREDEINMKRGMYLAFGGSTPYARGAGAGMMLDAMTKQGIQLRPNDNTALGRLQKMLMSTATGGIQSIQKRDAASLMRTAGGIGGNLLQDAMKEMLSAAGSEEAAKNAAQGRWKVEDQGVASGKLPEGMDKMFSQFDVTTKQKLEPFSTALSVATQALENFSSKGFVTSMAELEAAIKGRVDAIKAAEKERRDEKPITASSGTSRDKTAAGRAKEAGMGDVKANIPQLLGNLGTTLLPAAVSLGGSFLGARMARGRQNKITDASRREANATQIREQMEKAWGEPSPLVGPEAKGSYVTKSGKVVPIQQGPTKVPVKSGGKSIASGIAANAAIAAPMATSPALTQALQDMGKKGLQLERILPQDMTKYQALAQQGMTRHKLGQLIAKEHPPIDVIKEQSFEEKLAGTSTNYDESKANRTGRITDRIQAASRKAAQRVIVSGRKMMQILPSFSAATETPARPVTRRRTSGRGKALGIGLGIAALSTMMSQAGQLGAPKLSGESEIGNLVGEFGLGSAENATFAKFGMGQSWGQSLKTGLKMGGANVALNLVGDKVFKPLLGETGGQVATDLGAIGLATKFMGKAGGAGAALSIGASYARPHVENKFGYTAGAGVDLAATLAGGAMFGPAGVALGGLQWGVQEGMARRGENVAAIGGSKMVDKDIMTFDAWQSVHGSGDVTKRASRLSTSLKARMKTLESEKLADQESGFGGKIANWLHLTPKQYTEESSKEFSKIQGQNIKLEQAISSGNQEQQLAVLQEIALSLSRDAKSRGPVVEQPAQELSGNFNINITVNGDENVSDQLRAQLFEPLANEFKTFASEVRSRWNVEKPTPALAK